MIVVNSSTRQFSIPGADLVFGVESDSGSERKYFQCPRYVGDNLDIAGSFVRMNYRNANGEIDSYLVDDLTVDGDNVTFTWELSPKTTMYKGQLTFVMCVVGADTKVKWHTTLGRGQVLEGLEPEFDVAADTADAVAALIAMVETQTAAVESVGETWVSNVKSEGATQVEAVQTAAKTAETASVAEIEAKGVNVRESIPDDYTTLSEVVDSLTRGRAGAIVCEAAGESIVVNDASDLPIQGLRVFGKSTQVTTTGKNLLDTNNLETFLNNLGREKTGIVVPITTDGDYSYYVGDSVTVYIGYADSLDTAATHHASALSGKPATGTVNLKAGQYFLLWFDTGIAVKDSTRYSLAFGGEITYEPYSGGKPSPNPDYPQEIVSLEPTVTVCGKNLLKLTGEDNTWNGITYTLNNDGTITVDGTATSLSYKNFTVDVPGGAYHFSGCPVGGNATNGCFLRVISVGKDSGAETVEGDDIGEGADFVLDKSATITARIVVRADVVADNLVFKPMLCAASTNDKGFEPYSEQTVALTHTLPGIPVTSGGNYTDSDGQQWICDEVDFERGVYVQRMGSCDLYDLVSKYCNQADNSAASDTILRFDFGYILGCAVKSPVLCNRFKYTDAHGVTSNVVRATECISSHSTADMISVFIDKSRLTSEDVAGFEEYLKENSVAVLYALITPIETALSETELAAYRALHTNKPNTTVLNDAGAHMVVKYAADTKLYIDNKITALIGG